MASGPDLKSAVLLTFFHFHKKIGHSAPIAGENQVFPDERKGLSKKEMSLLKKEKVQARNKEGARVGEVPPSSNLAP